MGTTENTETKETKMSKSSWIKTQAEFFRRDPSAFIGAHYDRGGSALELAQILNAAGFYLKAGLDTNRWTAQAVRRLFALRDNMDVCAELGRAAHNPANFRGANRGVTVSA